MKKTTLKQKLLMYLSKQKQTPEVRRMMMAISLARNLRSQKSIRQIMLFSSKNNIDLIGYYNKIR